MISDDADVIVKNLDDFQDVQLFTEMYVGSEKQGLEVIFDTGSNWFWVQSSDCENCPADDSFDETSSETYVQTSKYEKALHYGSGSVYGLVS